MKLAFAAAAAMALAAGIIGGTTADMQAAAARAGERAVSLGLTLTGTMMIWCGLAEILREAGDDRRLGNILRRLLGWLFPGLRDDEAWSAMCMNLSANMLGLGNAATPYGLAAARRLAELGQPGLRALAMLLVLNNSGLQWTPTTVMAVRAAAGSANPAAVWLPTMASSGAATIAAVIMMKAAEKGREAWNRRRR